MDAKTRIERLGYRVTGTLGQGASGVVFAGIDAEGQQVAVKVLDSGSPFAPRFRREARLLVRLQHPHLVTGRAAHEREGVLVMDRIAAPSLKAQLAGVPLAAEHALAVLAQIGAALAFLHEGRVWHRDVNPGNVLYDPALRRAWLCDLGLAKDLEARPEAGAIAERARALGGRTWPS